MSNTNEFPKKDLSSNGTSFGYAIEVRKLPGLPPMVLSNGFVVASEWVRLPLEKSVCGEGIVSRSHGEISLARHGLLTYEAAQALRFAFYAAHGFCGVESRLVRHKINYTLEIIAEKGFEYMGGEGQPSPYRPEREDNQDE